MSTREDWLDFAMMRAALGKRVAYVTARHASTREAFQIAEELAKRKPFGEWVARIYLTRGEQHILFITGGAVMFLDPGCHNYRGLSSDVLILEPDADTPGTATSLLGAKVVYRTHEAIPEIISELKGVKRFRTKSVEVEAMQWPAGGAEDDSAACQRAAIHRWVWNNGGRTWVITPKGNPDDAHVAIETVGGNKRIGSEDWIVRGAAGEFSRCKPDIFAQTHELS